MTGGGKDLDPIWLDGKPGLIVGREEHDGRDYVLVELPGPGEPVRVPADSGRLREVEP